MKNIKKLIAVIIMCCFGATIGVVGIFVNDNSKKEATLIKWKENALVNPTPGKMIGAGNIDITIANLEDIYENSEKYGKVNEYNIYIDGEKQFAIKPDEFAKEEKEDEGFVSGMKLEDMTKKEESISDIASVATVEFHCAKTNSYEIYIEADYDNGSKIYSDVFTIYISKKGLCVNKDMSRELAADKMNASWYYNWDITPFNYYSFENMEYIPMMWTYGSTEATMIERLKKMGYKYLLAYNEPDFTDQSNLSVDEVVDAWPDFMNKGIQISSPATALCPPWSKDWFQPFMEKIDADDNLSIDFIALHHYWNWYSDEGVQAFLDLIDQTYEMYHKPIWITEFAISGDPGKNQEQLDAVIGYMKGVIPGLEERDYVERYAWFSFGSRDSRNGASALYDISTGEFTELGKLYSSVGIPAGYQDDSVDVIKENDIKDILIK